MEKCSGNMGYIITGYNNSLQERQCLYIVRKKSIIATQTTKGALWSSQLAHFKDERVPYVSVYALFYI